MEPINILLVEDNPGDARLIQEYLNESGIRFNLTVVDRLESGIARLKQEGIHVVLLDLSLPDSSGLDTLVKMHQAIPSVPIVVLTGTNDETLGVQLVQAGAQDYLVKGQVTSYFLARSQLYAIERQRTEEKIKEQAALLDITPNAITVRDKEGVLLYWNKGAERLYGWKEEEVLQKKVHELLCPKGQTEIFWKVMQQVMENGSWSGELNQVNREGQLITVESRWSLVRDDSGKPKAILVSNTDITEKKKLENQLLRAQRMESLGTLAAGIAHDLNNVLAPILMAADLLRKKMPDEQSQKILQIVETSAQRGTTIVKQVLSFGRGVEGGHTLNQVRHIIAELVKVAKETFPKSIEIVDDVPKDLWLVSGDSTQLGQVLMNLCVNARDAMPDGGSLKLFGENVTIDENYARLNIDAKVGPYVVITVSDTGTGIPPQIMERIFEPFFTTKEQGKGTGLGLSTVYSIVRGHGGFVNVYSEVGKGTTFKVYLPANTSAETQQVEAKREELPQGKGEMILVVDDEVSVRDMTKASLEANGYKVITANDGAEAIALYLANKDAVGAVIMDMMMPIMDGRAAIRALRKIEPTVRIIAASGLMETQKLTEIPGNEVQYFLTKPFSTEKVLEILRQVLSK